MPLRSLLPWRRLTVETAWSPADVEREIGFLVDQPPCDSDEHGAWCGTRWLGGFRIARRVPPISGRTVVIASGSVRSEQSGSRVLVTIRLPVPVALFLAAGISSLTLLSAAVSAAAIVRDDGVALLVWTMPLVMWPGIVRPFLSEAHGAEDFLRKFFPPPAPPSLGPFR
jgi:hypothetical protein